MLVHFIAITLMVVICVFIFRYNSYSQCELKKSIDVETINLKANPSNFSLIRKFLKRLYSDDFETDTFGSKGFATWGRIIKFYSKDECKHLDIKIEYKSKYSYNDDKEIRVLHSIQAYLQDDSSYPGSCEYIFNVNFMQCIDSRSEKYIQVKKPYKFVKYTDKNFEKFVEREEQRLEEKRQRQIASERKNISKILNLI